MNRSGRASDGSDRADSVWRRRWPRWMAMKRSNIAVSRDRARIEAESAESARDWLAGAERDVE